MARTIPANNIRNFWAKVQKTDSCWFWTGCVDKCGYGQITIQYKMYKAHRVSWEMHCSDIPKGLLVCHHCDNPGCVNPEHLFLGTQKTNADDMVAKNRSLTGSKNHQSVLTEEDVLEIKALLATKEYSYPQIAAKFNVTVPLIWQIKDNRAWKHVVLS
jgi:hypothetical protein